MASRASVAEGNTRFFGVEFGAVKIADSPPAPLFRLRTQPNDWAAQVANVTKESSSVTGKGVFYVQFWERFLERIHSEHPGWTNARKAGPANWLTLPCLFKGGPFLSPGFAGGGKLRTAVHRLRGSRCRVGPVQLLVQPEGRH